MTNRKRHFDGRVEIAKRQVYRLTAGQLLCQILLTRAQRTCLGESYTKIPAKNVLCSNGNTLDAKNNVLVFLVLPFEHKTFWQDIFCTIPLNMSLGPISALFI